MFARELVGLADVDQADVAGLRGGPASVLGSMGTSVVILRSLSDWFVGTEDGCQRGDDLDRRGIRDAVPDRLAVAPRRDNAGLAQHGEVLRQRGLRESERLLQRAGRQFARAKLAQDHQALLVAERTQEVCGLAGAGFEVGERECLQVHHAWQYMSHLLI